MEYVIIGNSAAAIGAAEGIRSADSEGNITIISDEPYHTYSRPLISYLLQGKTDIQKMKYRRGDFYEKNNIKTILGRKAVNISSKEKSVLLDNGVSVKYDKLLVSTGSSPFIPHMEGVETVENCFTFMSLGDALALEKVLTKNSKALIIGAGLIGIKAAEGIAGKVKSITVVDLSQRILSSILDDAASEMIIGKLKKHGIEFKLGTSVDKFDKNSAFLKNGETVNFDILIIAVGVKPNVSLVKEAGGVVGKGIKTNSRQMTSINDIYAAGDCTESYDITINENRILALLPNAYMQGETAGKNMAGVNCEFENAMPMNAVGFFGTHIITAGTYIGEDYIEKTDDTYKRLCCKDNLLKGYILIGNIQRAGIYTSIIREQIPLSDMNFEKIKRRPAMYAFSKARRDKILAHQ